MADSKPVALQERAVLRILAYLVQEYGEANEEWTAASLRVPDVLLVEDAPQVMFIRDQLTKEMVVTVSLEEKKEPPKKLKKKFVESVCKHCDERVFFCERRSIWLHKQTGAASCRLFSKGDGKLAAPRIDITTGEFY